jgi:hypothetical protein
MEVERNNILKGGRRSMEIAHRAIWLASGIITQSFFINMLPSIELRSIYGRFLIVGNKGD